MNKPSPLSTTVPPERTSPYAEVDRAILAHQLRPKPKFVTAKITVTAPTENSQPCSFCVGTGTLQGANPDSWARDKQTVPCWVCKGKKVK